MFSNAAAVAVSWNTTVFWSGRLRRDQDLRDSPSERQPKDSANSRVVGHAVTEPKTLRLGPVQSFDPPP